MIIFPEKPIPDQPDHADSKESENAETNQNENRVHRSFINDWGCHYRATRHDCPVRRHYRRSLNDWRWLCHNHGLGVAPAMIRHAAAYISP
jgi:hypothetical protein